MKRSVRSTKVRSHSLATLAVVSGLILSASGCADKQAESPNSASGQSANGESVTEELTAADRALIEAQVVCPVGGGELGSMGTPVKVMVEGDPIFICCESCREPLLESPDKYLPRIEEEKQKRGLSTIPSEEQSPEANNEQQPPS
ncbi:hypothetical protein KOR42_26710 [Thalassoglobus neptunius]|uniref:TRASH transcription regulator C-terminal archaeal domain-containing protein n=1 Tax=Thalassoglobus neptunius TaxID=1938619 RepID=A0A5C5WX60_9PLAN|nr:hypothetical protein [Thalassoglobus neptunius]TWT55544.1 hypothetical protein KOR42_26710 [Thalassoglobus neptunius]